MVDDDRVCLGEGVVGYSARVLGAAPMRCDEGVVQGFSSFHDCFQTDGVSLSRGQVMVNLFCCFVIILIQVIQVMSRPDWSVMPTHSLSKYDY